MDYWNNDEDLRNFLRAGMAENSGVLALCVCIAGDIDANKALGVFCGVSCKKYVHKYNTEPLDVGKLRKAIEDSCISYEEMCKAVNKKKGTFANLFYKAKGQAYCYKEKTFIRACEKALGMNAGDLVYKGV